MAEVWVATNVKDDGERYALIRADDVRHLRLVGDRPRLLAQVPGGEVSGWVALADSPAPATRFSGVMDGSPPPPLPDHFHLELTAVLDAARLQASKEGYPVIVRPVLDGAMWRWKTETYGAALGERRALTEVSAPRAAAS
jgi:hypothetical protein